MIGTLLGNRYELIEKIGEGGMAEVYKAKCHLLNRFVAVKILKQQFCSDKEFVDKFKREATAAASLSDNNIVNIYDVGSEGNINYIVMEYVKGKTLKQIIKESGKIEYNKAIDIAMQITKALDCAHSNNLVHRDIKPHNILVTDTGLVKVTDFGIAKVTSSVTITNSNKVVGSAHYFSPEQAKGSFVDCRTDIYSLGIVLYEMITGRVPYDADSPVSVALKHIQEKVVPPKQLVPFIPESLNKLILKAVEKDPIKRYQTAKEMLADLQRIKSDPYCNIDSKDIDYDETRIMDPVMVDDNNNDDSDDYYDDEKGKGNNKKGIDKKKKTIIIASIAAIVIIIGAILGFMVAGKNSSPNNKNEVTVPSIIGLSKDDADAKVTKLGLKFVVSNKRSSDKPDGTILECYPTEGTNVKVNSEVRVTVSNGSKGMTVPDVTGCPLSSAKDILKTNELEVGNVDYEYSDNEQKGNVISQDPKPDTEISKGKKVNLIVSNGPRVSSKSVPDLNGRTLNEAKAMLSTVGLQLGRTTYVSTDDRSKDGRIFNQNPDPKSQVKEGSAVDVTYYKYTEDAS